MPSRAYQRLTVISRKKKTRKNTRYLGFVAKTGYYNVWIGGTHYYYNQKDEKQSLKDVDMHNYFPSTAKKGTIVVRRK